MVKLSIGFISNDDLNLKASIQDRCKDFKVDHEVLAAIYVFVVFVYFAVCSIINQFLVG